MTDCLSVNLLSVILYKTGIYEVENTFGGNYFHAPIELDPFCISPLLSIDWQSPQMGNSQASLTNVRKLGIIAGYEEKNNPLSMPN